MDSGIAAVLGAAVGALGTGVAAWTTGWLGARTAEQQIVAHHMQAENQRRFEHERDRREPRSQAYSDLIAQTQAVGTRVTEMNRSEAYAADKVRQVMEEISQFLRCRARVMVEGPASVADATEDLVQAVSECQDVLMALASIPGTPLELRDTPRELLIGQCREVLEPLAEALGSFVEAARESLENTGTEDAWLYGRPDPQSGSAGDRALGQRGLSALLGRRRGR
jgi:hypothetical protein